MDSVKVALRIRPLVNSEIEIGCRPCIERIPNEPQVAIGKGRQMFTFNYVFDENEGQTKVYDDAVKSLIDNLFKGYNVTILAYGQTGSGKTHTMGTNYSGDEELGIIPRAVYDIFNRINSDLENEFKVTVNFIELYNESLFDLLTQKPREQSIVEMREVVGGICIPGLTEIEVNSPNGTLNKLKEGSGGRVVGSTAMNAQSSRSHAIFTISVRIVKKNNIVNSKFHLVDLAGSERSKKTGTTGERFKEGVNINKGLLVLGNVISQLCEGNHSYINYRDSKLTRLLQDSLGGNSVTLMIACVSPADYNQDETISTLRYADRARKIKNKPIVNLDPQLAEISRLRRENEELRLKMIGGEISGCPPEHQCLEEKLTDASKKINELSKVLGAVLSQNTNMFEKTMSIENAESALKIKLNELFKLLLTERMSNDESHLNEVRTKIAEVQDEQQKLESEISNLDKDNVKQNDEKEDNAEVEMQEDVISKQQDHVLLQAQINHEIFTLSKNLKWKEDLVEQLTENSSILSIDELKKQLVELQQEKEELLKQIKSNSQHAQNSSAKVAESRRKRLQELEAKVATLMKKVVEQERIIKLKEKSEEKINKLRQEIVEMKHLKVKLIQQLKSENDKFKTFKTQKDREVCQLKNQNMKKQNELKRMEQMHVKQQNVLRRKLEAAAAANKRVMAALERQKASRDKKPKGSSTEKIKERMTEELELIESEYQAQKSLDYLMLDRAALTKELAVIKASLADKSISDEEKIKLKTDGKQVEHELELRTVEISDLQQKLIDIHQADDQTRSYWDVIQSMSDAKCALSHLFNITSEKIIESVNKSLLLNEVMVNDIIELTAKTEEVETFKFDLKKPETLEKSTNKIEEESSRLLNNNQEEKKNSGNLNETFKVDDNTPSGSYGSVIYDPSKDPDWREDTPIHKRLQALKFSQSLRKRTSSNDEQCACVDCCADDCKCINSFFSCNRNCPCDLINCLSSKRLKPISRIIDFNLDAPKQSADLN
ncbi:chromosome-associated kinesin KIF4 isoform X3 [Halyomorpha halys]|uniref:chromosome-associated kinesin KIF4 isoform X3 n=1 Tax=Halyomorpha halys TaxID=286706 RepID=UPI0006D4D285|nr:chromosome-associated kinesin KIF4-like isoform X3 [Halyomorpha halys]